MRMNFKCKKNDLDGKCKEVAAVPDMMRRLSVSDSSPLHAGCLVKSRVFDVSAPSSTACYHLVEKMERQAVKKVVPGRKSTSHIDDDCVMDVAPHVAAVLGIKVLAADMPPFMQLHALRCARRVHDTMPRFSPRQMAHDLKKEFDKVYGAVWHCIVGASFGSFVTHSSGCFVYFSMETILVMLFKTKIRSVIVSSGEK